jgi:hypothetical protein
VNEQLLTFIGEPVLDAMQRVIAHMFYLPGKVIDTIERKESVEKPPGPPPPSNLYAAARLVSKKVGLLFDACA